MHPPKWADRFLEWYCSEIFLEEIQGDLHEQFHLFLEEKGPRGARIWYIIQVFRFFRLFRLKSLPAIPNPIIYTVMLPNYLITAYRNLLRHKFFSFINIAGLSIGMAACLMILRYVSFELSYDQFHAKSDEVFRIYLEDYRNNDLEGKRITTGHALGRVLQDEMPDVVNYTRYHPSYESRTISYNAPDGSERIFNEENLPWVDSSFLSMFSYELIEGDAHTVLGNPSDILLSETTAKKYFGESDPMGKTLKLNGRKAYIVAGIFKDLPENTHLRFDMLRSMKDVLSSRQYQNDEGWGWQNFYTYVQLRPGSDTTALMSLMQQTHDRIRGEDLAEDNARSEIHLQPITEIHLTPGFQEEPTTATDRTTIYFFALIALLILMIAWVNYMNLSTARAMERAREVGIRKTIGAHRSQLIRQFLLESFLINGLAVGLAVLLSSSFLPVLSEILGKNLALTYQDNTQLWIALGGLFVIGALISGLYPAFVLSSFKPVDVMKGLANQMVGGISVRKVLVVVQFAASVALIAGTYAVYQQITYMKTQDLGMNIDQVLVVKGPSIFDRENKDFRQTLKTFKTELLTSPDIHSVSSSEAIPGGGYNWGTEMKKMGADASDIKGVSIVFVDFDFVETYELEVIAGRPFSESYGLDGNNAMINEAAVKAFNLGTPEEALNQYLDMDGDTIGVVAVLKDYAWNSMRETHKPFFFAPNPASNTYFNVKVSTQNLPETISLLEDKYTTLFPGNPFNHFFQDEFFNKQYKADQEFGNVFGMFTLLAILVACLGLFGLAAFTVSQRLREIGIRKILGASVSQLLVLLSKDFLLLVGIANLVGIPLAYWGISRWLESYAFRISLEPMLFIVPIVFVGLLAFLTVSIQTLRATRMNPVEALRQE